jgi:cysteine-rich repeat protein
MLRLVLVLLALAKLSCTRSEAVLCEGGRICPPDTTCDEIHRLCVAHEQTTVCGDEDDGFPCTAGAFRGVCDRGYCIEGCGDGAVGYDWARQRDEECDDGNYRSHDGCSSSCRTELPGWVEWISPWQPRAAHASVYDKDRGMIVLFGGIVQDGADDSHWERDQNRIWRRIDGSLRPPALRRASLAYDAGRKVVVLFGGFGAGYSGQTWEYDGAAWRQVMTASAPSAREAAAMVFDTVRGKTVLFGGVSAGPVRHDDTWEYDGTSWAPIATIGKPGARSHAAMVWDSGRDVAVLFGGLPHNNQTWEWNGATASWTQVATGGAPRARHSTAMAYYPVTSTIYLFGGTGTNDVTLADMWKYEIGSQTWSQLAGDTAPPVRTSSALEYDPINSRLVLMAGGRVSALAHDDVWEYAFNGTWTDRTPEFPPRGQVRLVEDTARGELVALRGDATWVFDAEQNWVHAALHPNNPSVRRLFGIAYDSGARKVVAFGGEQSCGTPFADTLEWDGVTRSWTVRALPGPSARTTPAMTFDSRRGVSILSGGAFEVCQSTPAYSDTWEYNGTSWTQTATDGPLTSIAAYDPDNERVVALAWSGATWVYEDGVWTELEIPNVAIDRGRTTALAFNPDRRRMTWYGGAATPTSSDLWELEDDGWRQVSTVGSIPPPRFYHSIASHRPSRSIVLFGGGAFGTTIGDTWLFSFRSNEPDERCDDGQDNDGDRLVDTDDPDCMP